ncbi:hemolysin type calcium-binding protein [Rhizobium subbaraonis]|uniref:Hemolysin type calcium-binding protein n=1 Tax=Rhizobium subbaraonis TaxID=908946 RepID=A0A285UWY3_9HYPH|nr:calcium-binding protein [Rhizobium subbaraonis]SOC45858.1 hemolysin type calcium-binding protein [Rhizobium subbaraonis]
MAMFGKMHNLAAKLGKSAYQYVQDLKSLEWLLLIDPVDQVILGTRRSDVLATKAEGNIVFGLGADDWLSSSHNRTALLGGSGDDKLKTTVVIPMQGDDPVKGLAIQMGGSGRDKLEATITLQGGLLTFPERQLSAEIRQDGGRGHDIIKATANLAQTVVADFTAKIHILGGSGDDRIDALADTRGALGDLLAKILVDGGSGDDYIKARAETELVGSIATASNILHGGSGDDVLDATAIGRSIATELVSNLLRGGWGDDILRAYNYTNSNSRAPVGVNELRGDQGNDQLEVKQIDTGNTFTDVTSRLYGGTGNDRLKAETTAASQHVKAFNYLEGGDGKDALEASLDVRFGSYEVANVLYGGAGNDRLAATITSVPASYSPGTFSVENRLDGAWGDDVLIATVTAGSLGSSFLKGGFGDDKLTVVGGTGNVLDGGAGRDWLIGGTGDDYMIGRAGADRFVFAPQNGHDKVDFDKGWDKIDLKAFAAVGIHAFADLDIDVGGGDSIVRFDTANDITVAGVTDLSADDFLFA